AQPVITSGANYPAIGYTDSIGLVPASSFSPGSGGANITWDFSSLNPTMAGKATVVNPSTTPYTAQFPAATHALVIEAMGNTIYEYDIMSVSKFEMFANNVTGSSGNDYTPNPKT